MRILFFGTPEFAIPSLRMLIDSGHDIPLVISQPDRAKGRGHGVAVPPVKEFAVQKGITILQPQGIRQSLFHNQLRACSPDAIVVVAYGRIIPPEILKIPAYGCINVHASLLPKYRGAAPIQWALINGEAETGITTMLMDEGLDTGDILLQERTAISEEETYYSLGIRLAEIGGRLLTKTLQGLVSGSVTPMPQTGDPSYAPPLKKEDGKIQWSKEARELRDLIRGTWPWPGAHCYLQGERITIIRATVTGDDFSGKPGTIVSLAGGDMDIAAGRGILRILELKPEGKKAMAAAAFIHGRHLREGMHFDSV